MCLGITGKIIEVIDAKRAMVDIQGIKKEIRIDLIENPKIGEYVMIHTGFAISKLDEKEAREIQEYFKEMGDLAPY